MLSYTDSQVYNFQRLYWTPAPPKFDIPPEAVKQQLIPRYQAPIDVIEEEMERLDELNDVIQDESSSEDDSEIEVTAKQRQRYGMKYLFTPADVNCFLYLPNYHVYITVHWSVFKCSM